MKIKDLIDAIQKLKPEEECLLKFQEANAEKTFKVTAIEVKDEGIYMHGNIIFAAYGLVSEYEMFIIEAIVRDINRNGVTKEAVVKLIDERID